MEETIKTATDKTAALLADANDRTKAAADKGQQMFAEMTSFAAGTLEALMESSRIAARGFETLGQDAAAYARKSFDDASATARTFAAVKSPAELLKLQGNTVRQSLDALVAETARGTEAVLKLVGEVAQPIANRVALAADAVKTAA